MFRITAAILFFLAAFDVPLPGVDRAGVALLALSSLAMVVGRRVADRKATPASLPPEALEPWAIDGDAGIPGFVERLQGYVTPGTPSSS